MYGYGLFRITSSHSMLAMSALRWLFPDNSSLRNSNILLTTTS